MVGRRGRPPKRKVEELQEAQDGKSKSAKEARIEAISLDASEPARMVLVTLKPDTWLHQDDAEEWSEHHISRISVTEEEKEGTLSRGTSWRAVPEPSPSKVGLSCRRVSNGESFDCETQTLHFIPAPPSKVVVVPDSDTSDGIKMEIDTEQQEEFLNEALVCCVEGCGASSDTDTTSTFYTVPKGRDKSLWVETLDIIPCGEGDSRQHVCSKHFITPTKLPAVKGKTRKKRTCDMLVAEEAEKIRQGLSSGRPKRTPKPNKNYDWAEIVPLIKSEPDYFETESYSPALDDTGSTASSPRKLLSSIKEDKENKRPTSDTEGDLLNDEEEEEEDDLENISEPSHPRPPPPKPKGRPHRIRDSGTQTESAYKTPERRQPLREVKVQCNITTEAPSPCTSCSYINWLRLEELLVDCAAKIDGDFCVPAVQECLMKVVDNVPHPTHATNVLKLLSGNERDALENTSDIVLVPNQEDEVEIENIIHTTVEEPITGVKEIIPKTWQKKTKWKKALNPLDYLAKEEDEEDMDGLGIQEATEMDDDEFTPGYLEGDETEEEDDQGLDDEDWTINKPERDARPAAKKKLKKTQQQPKVKKGQMPVAGEGQQGSVASQTPHTSTTRAKKTKRIRGKFKKDSNRDDRSEGMGHQCLECGVMFKSLLEVHVHRQQVHTGPSTWQPQYQCQTCGQTFDQKRSLYKHCVVQHRAPRRYLCDQCDYEGPRLFHLKRHMKVHTGERNHVCEVCSKGLKSLQAYRNHMVLHTNKGRYHCVQCDKAFNQRTLYEDHCRTHSTARRFTCKYCDAAFKTYKNVACHIRAVHLGDKRFICDICGAQHMTSANLRVHQKIHQDATSLPHAYHCDLCNASFRGLQGLTVHLEVLHGVVEEVLEEFGKGATSKHPTRRPQHMKYAVMDDGEEETKKMLVQEETLMKMDDVHREIEREEENERAERENEEHKGEMKEGDETEVVEVQEGVEVREGFGVSGNKEEEDGRTVLVESENFVFRVRPEEIEFELY